MVSVDDLAFIHAEKQLLARFRSVRFGSLLVVVLLGLWRSAGAQVAVPPVPLVEGWEYRWGPSPSDSTGAPR